MNGLNVKERISIWEEIILLVGKMKLILKK